MTERHYWEVTELNTREVTYENAVQDILYGSDYRKHEFGTKVEAEDKMKELKDKGIHTSIAEVYKYD